MVEPVSSLMAPASLLENTSLDQPPKPYFPIIKTDFSTSLTCNRCSLRLTPLSNIFCHLCLRILSFILVKADRAKHISITKWTGMGLFIDLELMPCHHFQNQMHEWFFNYTGLISGKTIFIQKLSLCHKLKLVD